MRALWIAADGTRHVIEGDTVLEIRNKVERLRKELGKPAPTLEHMQSFSPEVDAQCADIPRLNELPKPLRDMVEEGLEETISKPDPSKLN